jgi:hypothetical protein
MDADPFPDWLVWAAPAWIAALVLLSIVFRRARGRPIFPRAPKHALFVERMASSRVASKCLIVAVTEQALTVTPFFPFNLMFLSEIFGMEHHILLADIAAATVTERLFGPNVIVTYDEAQRTLGLRVGDPAGLVAALARGASARSRP